MSYSDSDAASIQTSVLSIHSISSMETLTPVNTTYTDLPPPYTAHDPHAALGASVADPRSESTQSLVEPTLGLDGADSRRKLLIIYIHGFMGNETNFQSFPAHVHNLLSVYLASSHVVHTKIYPRYLSRSTIWSAAVNFSNWLSPHVTSDTDLILVGHSIGGILASEVVLLPSDSAENSSPFKHQVVGTINYDTPFLGMHPGVIRSGLSSLFRPDPMPLELSRRESSSSSQSSSVQGLSSRQNSGLTASQPQDPNFNPYYDNDVRLADRSGWKNASHFVHKHVKNLRSATQNLITSHIQFSSCLSDFDGLRFRYARIRALEEHDVEARERVFYDPRTPPRVRFVNYYTASTRRHVTSPVTPANDLEATTPTMESTFINPTSGADMEELPAGAGRSIHAQEELLEDDELSEDGSSISDLSDLDPLHDSQSATSGTLSSESPSEAIAPDKVVRQNSDPASSTSATSQTYLPPCPFTLDWRSSNSPHSTKKAFKTALRQHHMMMKHNFHELKSQQKAEYLRLLREATTSPLSRKTQIQTFLEAQKADRNRFYEAAKADWKQMYDRLKKDFAEATKADIQAWKEAEKSRGAKETETNKIEEKSAKFNRRTDKRLERHNRSAARKIDKIERKLARHQSKRKDFSVDSVSESVSTLTVSQRQSSSPVFEKQASLERPSASTSSLTPDANEGSSSYEPSIRLLPPYHEEPQSLANANSSSLPATSTLPSSKGLTEPLASQRLQYDSQGYQKGNKFCMRPPKDASGNHDATWIRVHMKGVDEVGAHCGLFFPLGPGEEVKTDGWSERYAWMVGDVADRIERWVGESMSERMASALHAENAM